MSGGGGDGGEKGRAAHGLEPGDFRPTGLRLEWGHEHSPEAFEVFALAVSRDGTTVAAGGASPNEPGTAHVRVWRLLKDAKAGAEHARDARLEASTSFDAGEAAPPSRRNRSAIVAWLRAENAVGALSVAVDAAARPCSRGWRTARSGAGTSRRVRFGSGRAAEPPRVARIRGRIPRSRGCRAGGGRAETHSRRRSPRSAGRALRNRGPYGGCWRFEAYLAAATVHGPQPRPRGRFWSARWARTACSRCGTAPPARRPAGTPASRARSATTPRSTRTACATSPCTPTARACTPPRWTPRRCARGICGAGTTPQVPRGRAGRFPDAARGSRRSSRCATCTSPASPRCLDLLLGAGRRTPSLVLRRIRPRLCSWRRARRR